MQTRGFDSLIDPADLMEFAEMLIFLASENKHPADMIYYLAARSTFSAIQDR